MGANDDILSDEGGADKGTGNPPPVTPTFDPSLVTKAVQDGLSGVSGQLNEHTKAIQQYVQQQLQGAQQRVQQGNATQDDTDLTQQLLSQPEKAIGGVVEKILHEQLGPYLSRQVQSDYQDNLDRLQTSIDGRWGPGAFDKFIKPGVEDIAGKTANPSARGDRAFLQAVSRQITGDPDTLDKLNEHQTKWKADADKADKDNDVGGTGVLGPGRRRTKSDSALTDDDRAYMEMVAEVTGDDVDLKKLDEVMKVKNRYGFLDSQVMPGVKNKLPVKGTAHRRAGTVA